MNIDILAEELGMTPVDLLPIVTRYDNQYNLGIKSVRAFTRIQYQVIRSLLDPDYLVRTMLNKDKAYDYSGTPGYEAMRKWVAGKDLNGLSTKEIKQKAEGRAVHCGPQALSAVMKAGGYVNRVIYLDTGKQGRRWFKETPVTEDTPSFF